MMQSVVHVLVHGAAGRLGQRVCALADGDDRFEVVATIGRRPSSTPDRGEHEFSGAAVDAVIDFSTNDGTQEAARIALRKGAALLVGTTGLTRQTLDVLDESARSCPVMIAPNTSRGVAIMNHLVAEAITRIAADWQVDLIEQHHRFKRDAPSGTARRLQRTIEAAGRPLPPERIHCVRAGEIVGDHDVQMSGPGERLRIVHSAISRDVFAAGALDAAAWLAGRAPGHYSIEDSLGLT